MKKEDLKIGQALYRKSKNPKHPIGFRIMKITKINRKYFFCDNCLFEPIEIANLRFTDKKDKEFSFSLYLTKEEALK